MSHTDEATSHDRELNVRFIVYTVVGLVVITALTFVLMSAMVSWMGGAERANDPSPSALVEANEEWVPPGPRLQEFPPTLDVDALHAWEEAQLNSFGWVDEGAGVIRIPVDVAVEVLARRGLEARGKVDALSNELFGGSSPSEAAAMAEADRPEVDRVDTAGAEMDQAETDGGTP